MMSGQLNTWHFIPCASFRAWGISRSPCHHVSQNILQTLGPLPFSLSPRLSVRPLECGTCPAPPVTSHTQRLRNYTTWDVPMRCPSSSYDIFRVQTFFQVFVRRLSKAVRLLTAKKFFDSGGLSVVLQMSTRSCSAYPLAKEERCPTALSAREFHRETPQAASSHIHHYWESDMEPYEVCIQTIQRQKVLCSA
jgi:hypothetical protein